MGKTIVIDPKVIKKLLKTYKCVRLDCIDKNLRCDITYTGENVNILYISKEISSTHFHGIYNVKWNDIPRICKLKQSNEIYILRGKKGAKNPFLDGGHGLVFLGRCIYCDVQLKYKKLLIHELKKSESGRLFLKNFPGASMELIEEHLTFQPGGEGYEETKKHFESNF